MDQAIVRLQKRTLDKLKKAIFLSIFIAIQSMLLDLLSASQPDDKSNCDNRIIHQNENLYFINTFMWFYDRLMTIPSVLVTVIYLFKKKRQYEKIIPLKEENRKEIQNVGADQISD